MKPATPGEIREYADALTREAEALRAMLEDREQRVSTAHSLSLAPVIATPSAEDDKAASEGFTEVLGYHGLAIGPDKGESGLHRLIERYYPYNHKGLSRPTIARFCQRPLSIRAETRKRVLRAFSASVDVARNEGDGFYTAAFPAPLFQDPAFCDWYRKWFGAAPLDLIDPVRMVPVDPEGVTNARRILYRAQDLLNEDGLKTLATVAASLLITHPREESGNEAWTLSESLIGIANGATYF